MNDDELMDDDLLEDGLYEASGAGLSAEIQVSFAMADAAEDFGTMARHLRAAAEHFDEASELMKRGNVPAASNHAFAGRGNVEKALRLFGIGDRPRRTTDFRVRPPPATVLLLAAGLSVGCSSGKGSVTADERDGGSHAGDATTTRDANDPDLTVNSPPPDVGNSADLSQPSLDAATDMPGEPDLGPPEPSPSTVYVAESDGTIHWGTFDPDAPSLALTGSVERGGSQNFLAFDSSGARLYAANGSSVEAFDLGADGTPNFIGAADAGVGGTALEVDDARQFAFVASYGGDAVAVLPLDTNGAPSDATQTFGGDSDPDFCRRAHQVRVHPRFPLVYVPCLGSDHIAGFRIDAGTIQALPPASVPAGSGPRHLDFHPTLPIAYVIGELDDTITVLDLDPTTGALTVRATVSTRPSDPGTLGPASDVHVAPDGRSVLGINRNPRDELVTFDADDAGDLTFRNAVSCGGEHARTFTFTPSGSFALVGNSNSQDVVAFDLRAPQPAALQTLTSFDSRVMYVGIRPR